MEKNNNINKPKFSFTSLTHNNRFLMFLSLVIAFILWTWVSIEKSPEIEKVITGIPVQINLDNTIPEQLGLQIFGDTEFTVDVTVKGKKYILATLDSDDVRAVANTNYVDSAGSKTLQLRITPTDNSNDFIIASSSETYIEVYFDKYKEIEVALEGVIDTELKSYVPNNCLAGDVVLSKTAILLSGPASEINRVTGVSAIANVGEVLEKTSTFDADIVIKTTDGTELEYTKVNTDNEKITMTIPVLKVVTLPTSVEFKNAPSYFINNPLKYSVYPSSVKVAVPVDAIDTIKNFVVSTIDFNDIANSYNTFYVNSDDINSYKIMDESVKRFRVNVNASDLGSKTLSVPASAIRLKNDRDDFNVRLSSTKDTVVTLVGPKNELEAITPDDVYIELNTADKTIVSDTKALSGRVVVSSDYNCWAVGKYDIRVVVEPLE